jgi:hypothetical protein
MEDNDRRRVSGACLSALSILVTDPFTSRTTCRNILVTSASLSTSRATCHRQFNNHLRHHLAPVDQCQTPPPPRRPLGFPALRMSQGFTKMMKAKLAPPPRTITARVQPCVGKQSSLICVKTALACEGVFHLHYLSRNQWISR